LPAALLLPLSTGILTPRSAFAAWILVGAVAVTLIPRAGPLARTRLIARLLEATQGHQLAYGMLIELLPTTTLEIAG